MARPLRLDYPGAITSRPEVPRAPPSTVTTPTASSSSRCSNAPCAGSAGRNGHLAAELLVRHPDPVDEEQGIYRDEVRVMMGALADIYVDTGRILAILGDEEEDDEAEEVDG